MLETMDGMVLCGTINWNETWEDIYCDPYGVLVFETYSDGGCWCLTEINIGQPMSQLNVRDLQKNIDNGVYGEAIGVIYGFEGNIIVLLNEDTAVERRLWEPLVNVGDKFYYSTDEEYDMEGFVDSEDDD